MQHNINPYCETTFKEKFVKTELYSKLVKEYDEIVFNTHFSSGTPRQICSLSRFSVVPFYYLEFLTKHNPTTIYDLGCGWNVFKKYIPNIIGIGAEDPTAEDFFADIHGEVSFEFLQNHQNYFDSVFSINALHFRPLKDLRQVVLEFASMIKPGGRGFLSMNLARMIEHDNSEGREFLAQTIAKKIENNSTVYDGYEYYIRQELDNVNFTYEIFDINISNLDCWMDGNIRMVIYKNEQE